MIAPDEEVSSSETQGFETLIRTLLPRADRIKAYFDRLWPICRSITGEGFRSSLKILSELCPFETIEIPSGEKLFDWTIPKEWSISDAWIEKENGEKIVDFQNNNLHVVGYSIPVDQWMDLKELDRHLYSLPDQPRAIPYVTSYYEERWGFCLTHLERQALKPGRYRAVVRSRLFAGSLALGHLVLPATQSSETDEVLISTYLCHPSMANNELSGPLVTAFLYLALSQLKNRRYHYRFVVVPETVGAIAYLSRYGDHLRKYCRAGLVVTCCGDDRKITYKNTRRGATELDRVVTQVLNCYGKPWECLSFSPLGSDERQYCSPGFNLPVGSLMRSMYGTYPEYHTSLDNKEFISFTALKETIELYLRTILSLEENRFYQTTVSYGEPMLGPRGLYPTLGSQKNTEAALERMMWLINYSDGEHDVCEIAQMAKCSILELAEIARTLNSKGLLQVAYPTKSQTLAYSSQ